ncbi:hypothetical protein POM88_045132 [Heracleum sosnowskyi]|uniref:Reverse transcriptase domain-containing protein n=1 Tax=Heracleum sosnowskyi TaxID=360622 RepID=A0AAD8H6I9_9APIA|nr:hypothetical protein POM88_045132 [Heracleum sosnowskyi]
MDVLSKILNKVQNNPDFQHHKSMKNINLNHLCFADDLILFSKVDKPSISSMMEALSIFHSYSGLMANPTKSSCYLANPPSGLQQWILISFGITLEWDINYTKESMS